MESMSSLSRGPSAKTARDLRNLKNSSKGSPTKYRWIKEEMKYGWMRWNELRYDNDMGWTKYRWIRRDEWDDMNQI